MESNWETELWQELWDLLGHDCKRNESPRQRFNRIFREQVGDHPPIPFITKAIRKAYWPLSQLTKFAMPQAGAAPKREDVPLVVVRWRDADFLIDGRRRINRWVEQADIGPHSLLLID